MKLQPSSNLLFIGDSVTDAGRAYPVGELEGIGQAYPKYVSALLAQAYPAWRIRVRNTGISGNTTRDLINRWDKDVLALKPDYVSVLIGVNDVWRQMDWALATEMHVYPEEYRANLKRMAEETLPHVKGMFFLSPFVVVPAKEDPMRKMCDEYGTIMKEVAEEYGITFVDVQKAFDDVCTQMPPLFYTSDRVHPNSAGQMLIARSFLDAVDFHWSGEELPK